MSVVCKEPRQDDEPIGCVVGAVLQVKPNMAESVRSQLMSNEQVEIHAEDAQCRWVITLESKTSKQVLKLTEAIQNIDGVLSVTPVYQHCEENIKIEQQEGGWAWR